MAALLAASIILTAVSAVLADRRQAELAAVVADQAWRLVLIEATLAGNGIQTASELRPRWPL